MSIKSIVDYLGDAGAGLISPYAGDSLESLLVALRTIIERSPELAFRADDVVQLAADHICVLDVLFEMSDPGTGYGVVKSGYMFGGEETGSAYKNLISTFVAGHNAIFLHPWFRAGLPQPRTGDAATDLEPAALTNVTLGLLLGRLEAKAGVRWAQSDDSIVDGVLFSERTSDSASARTHCNVPAEPLVIDSVNARIDRQLTDLSFRSELGEKDLNGLWHQLAESVLASPSISSPAGLPAHSFLGIPFGFRDPANPAKFSLVATIFLVLDVEMSFPERIRALLRTIAIYFYRTSAPIIAQQAAMTSAQSAWAHEIKHIGAAIQGNWLVPATQFFDIYDSFDQPIRVPPRQHADPPRRGAAVGRLTLNAGFEDLASDLDLTIYGRSMRAVGTYLQFSAALDDADDQMPGEGNGDLIRAALDQAFASLLPKVYMEMRPSVATLRRDLLLDLAVRNFCDVMSSRTRLWVNGTLVTSSLRTLPWRLGVATHGKPVTPARFVSVLAAMLRNVFQHGSLREPIIIRLDYSEESQTGVLQTENTVSDHGVLRREQVNESWLSLLHDVPDILTRLASDQDAMPEAWAKHFATLEVCMKGQARAANREDTKSEAVVRFYMRNYAGNFSSESYTEHDHRKYRQIVDFNVDVLAQRSSA